MDLGAKQLTFENFSSQCCKGMSRYGNFINLLEILLTPPRAGGRGAV